MTITIEKNNVYHEITEAELTAEFEQITEFETMADLSEGVEVAKGFDSECNLVKIYRSKI